MLCYTLYHLNRSSGHIDRVEEIDAADDVRATMIARAAERDSAAELWHEGRKILRLERPADMPLRATRRTLGIAIAG